MRLNHNSFSPPLDNGYAYILETFDGGETWTVEVVDGDVPADSPVPQYQEGLSTQERDAAIELIEALPPV
jgi:hypothetical protein